MRADADRISRLLKTARGQIDGILKMVEEDRYCIDISTQLIAVGAVLRRANRDVLCAHMEGCVREAMGSADPEAAAGKIDELCGVLDKMTR